MVNLTKDETMLRMAQVRTPGNGDTYDLIDWANITAPLWWDDASYARYQADDPQGYWVYELKFNNAEELSFPNYPIVARFVGYEEDRISYSRSERIEMYKEAVKRYEEEMAQWRIDSGDVPF